jgi:GH15 family glucan-1,4-alpha-glucosidase
MFTPTMLIRRIKRVRGAPRIRIRVRPSTGYGGSACERTFGSNHIRYIASDMIVRLTTDASITSVMRENAFFLGDRVTLIFGPDETIPEAVGSLGQRFLKETLGYWQNWIRSLAIPFEWQDEVIRAAISLKLNTFDDTGAIIAAMTTSVPEAPDTLRNWDYRYCWLRDAYFVVNALNRLGATRTMEHYLSYLLNVVAGAGNGALQPVYGIDGRAMLEEREAASLPGYRGMGPVRVGNQAYQQSQHDVYGSGILAVSHLFIDRRLVVTDHKDIFRRLERLGEKAVLLYDKPDAGLWEYRGRQRIHTFSSLMCWASCDRLAKIAAYIGIDDRAAYWQGNADRIHAVISEQAWDEKKKSFTGSFGGSELDASLLLMHDIGFLKAGDPRFASTVAAIERELRQGNYVFRYTEEDDFGAPRNAFAVCTFWYVHALSALGRTDEARDIFENMLARRNRHGLLAEHIDVRTGELWGNFVQTYSMVGLVNSAIRLSKRWDSAF